MNQETGNTQPRTDEAPIKPMYELGEEVVLKEWVWKVTGCDGATLTLDVAREYLGCPHCGRPMAPENVERTAAPPDEADVPPPWVCSVCDAGKPEPDERDSNSDAGPTQPPAPDTDPSESDPVDAAIAGAEDAEAKPPTEGEDKPFVG